MAAVSSATSAASSTATASSSSSQLAGNFQSFLSLLTTQLKNQSPLDPLNTNEFTQQLVQFASVEQQLQANESLTALLASTRTATIVGATGLVGAKVTADGAVSKLSGGAANWRMQAPRAVSGATLTVTDSSGNVVYAEKRNLAAGAQSFAWNGRTSAGAAAPDGEYTLKITAADASGQTVAVKTELEGTVEKVDLTGTEPTISIGSIIVPLSKVKTVQKS